MNTDLNIQPINPEDIAGYVIRRSLESNFLFDVFAVNSEGELLVNVESDIGFEEVTEMVDAINMEYYPIVPTPTEVAFIEIGGESKVYNITSTLRSNTCSTANDYK